jgi:hypothetical protein
VALSALVLFAYEEKLNKYIVTSHDMKTPSGRKFAALITSMRYHLLASLAVILLVTGMASAQSRIAELSPTGFQVGQAFPTLSLPSVEDGRPLSLADFRGKKVILHIFASW